MRRLTLLLAVSVVASPAPLPSQSLLALRAGMVIDRSTTIRPGTYRLSSTGVDVPVLIIRGKDIDVDFAGVELVGSRDGTPPDLFAGLAILVDGGERVTIRNARIRGYKVGILARRVNGLKLTGNDVSHNWKQRLYSRVEKESLVDWMSYHQNERDEWLRYGAGIYLSDVDDADINRNRAVQGQNGLMATRSKHLRIWNNEFSFLSSIGVGLYRTTDSTIMHNKIDWCVRGYSHGFYNRGQDSAGLLMYEQSSRNVVAYNSITHGGDGLFLWAGQSTMDTGEGGSNDNLFYGNDFSHAPTNGIEATFSRNTFVANRVEENWHGVWGGYSFDSVIANNTFARNQEAIAIEHGQNNVIAGNTFTNDETVMRLWSNERQDPNWEYPKRRDTRSRDYTIAGNTISGHKVDFDITGTTGVHIQAEALANAPKVDAPARFADGIDAMIPPGQRRGRQFIIVDEWGPYDWRGPKLWPAGRSDASPLELRVLGPDGTWHVQSVRGASVSSSQGTIPSEVIVKPSPSRIVDFEVNLRDNRGQAFGYSRFFVPIDWAVRFFDFGSSPDAPSSPAAFAAVTKQTPAFTEKTDRLDYLSSRSIAGSLANDHVALVAEGEAVLPNGQYVLRAISDDGVRVWVDGALVIDHWAAHESEVDEVPIRGGRRRFRVDYFENMGFAELRVEIVKSLPRK